MIDKVAKAVEEILKKLGAGGVMLILWTFVMCAAFLQLKSSSLEKHWEELYYTWIVIAGIYFATVALFGLGSFVRSYLEERRARKKKKPKLTHEFAQALPALAAKAAEDRKKQEQPGPDTEE
jgi:thiol:disulfide interchange protein